MDRLAGLVDYNYGQRVKDNKTWIQRQCGCYGHPRMPKAQPSCCILQPAQV